MLYLIVMNAFTSKPNITEFIKHTNRVKQGSINGRRAADNREGIAARNIKEKADVTPSTRRSD